MRLDGFRAGTIYQQTFIDAHLDEHRLKHPILQALETLPSSGFVFNNWIVSIRWIFSAYPSNTES